MKRVIYFTLFCFLIALKGKTQTYFSNRYNLNNANNTTQQFLFNKDTFYLSSILLGDTNGLISRVALNGNSVPTNKYPGFLGKYFQPYTTTKYGNNFYSSGAGGFLNTISSPFFKFNSNCDTISTKFIGDSSYYFLTSKIIPYTRLKDKLLLIGVTDSNCGPGHQSKYKPIIKLVDTNGVILQSKTFLSSCKYRNITGIDTCESKGYLLCGSELQTYLGNYFVMKLDSNLNLIWTTYYNSTSRNICSITKSKNGGYFLGHTLTDSIWNFTYTWERITLTKLNTNGTIKWQKNYGIKQTDIATSKVIELTNGDVVLTGNRRVGGSELKGFIIRTDSLGNLKWWKDYRPITIPLDTIAQNYLYDVLELPNKEIAAVGWAGQSIISPLQQTWLLKVDSNGCFGSSNCPPNVITVIKENNSNSVELTAYPNPFKDELKINYSILDFEGVAQLQLIELASGRLIDNIELTQSFGTKQFNTQNLANGLYVLSLKQNNKPSVNFKVINIK